MRKTATFTATIGRDKGKEYLITEMDAYHAEMWAIRVVLAIGGAGIEIPAELAQQGVAGLLAVGYMNLLKVSFGAAKPLLDEMMECVQFVPSPMIKRALIESDIEEVKTRLQIRKAIWDLHADFFLDESTSTSGLEAQTQTINPSSTIKTPRKQSPQ